ncbi:GntR family transcriptional regulator, partial [Escherichia coli]
PSERELSERFNTSRTTIREAIIMLELKGVLNVKQGSGIFFVDSTDKLNQKSLMPYSEIGPFELLQARQVIESNITGFAASQISFNELQELKKIIGLQEKAIAAESDKFEDLD